MGGSSGGGGGTNVMRYADYIEVQHKEFLATVAARRTALVGSSPTMVMSRRDWLKATYGTFYESKLNATIRARLDTEYAAYVATFTTAAAYGGSPFADYVDIDVDTAFFGAGYCISSFPSLYEMYGTYMSGLSLDDIWADVFADTVNSAEVRNLVVAEAALMDDDIEDSSLPRLQAGMRDMNAVLSSSFVIGKAIIEDAKTKALSKFSADLKYRLIPIAAQRWSTTLDWNKNLVSVYAEIMKFYYSAKTDIDEINYSMAAKDLLWPFTVLDFERAALGALQGAMTSKTDVAGASTTSKVISGALSGAAMGAMVGSAWNTAPVAASAGNAAVAGSAAGSMYGAGIGAVLGIGAALTY